MAIPNHKKDHVIKKAGGDVEASSFQSIIPDPETLERLEKICPGATHKWMELAETEIKSRQVNEGKVISTFQNATLRGQVFAFLTAMVICGVGAYCIYMGSPTQAAAIISGSAAAVIIAFLTGKHFSK